MNSIDTYSRRILSLSLLLSLVTIVVVIWMNLTIAAHYNAATGKTRALFGIIELTYAYKYYFAVGSVFATLLGIVVARSGRRQRRLAVVAIIMGLVSLSLVFLRVWTLMIDHSA